MATYNDWPCVAALLPLIDAQLTAINRRGRVVVVDDGSTSQEGRAVVQRLGMESIDCVTSLNLARNLGNQRALAVGLAYVAEHQPADHVIVMDSDHEDNPAYIPDLIKACEASTSRSIIFAARSKRSEGLVFTIWYSAYKALYQVLTGMPIAIGNFSVIPRQLLRRLASVSELWSHYPAAIMRSRISYGSIPSDRGVRYAGKSNMSLVSLVLHALSGFAVHSEIVGVRILLATVGTALTVLTLMGVVVGLKFFTDLPILGWTSQIVALLLVLLFQMIITTLIMVFIVITMRTQVPLIPLQEYRRFVAEVEPLLPPGPPHLL
ncbi:hypothetical protein WV31_12895 [Magnetospirillum sp. ME-1]|nr:hypothetical protein WV31_12895 [Magnetospirillum sp. ME-1]